MFISLSCWLKTSISPPVNILIKLKVIKKLTFSAVYSTNINHGPKTKHHLVK